VRVLVMQMVDVREGLSGDLCPYILDRIFG